MYKLSNLISNSLLNIFIVQIITVQLVNVFIYESNFVLVTTVMSYIYVYIHVCCKSDIYAIFDPHVNA